MSRRARKEEAPHAPEWPERLRLPAREVPLAALVVPGPLPTFGEAEDFTPALPRAQTTVALFLGHLKDGRHVAAELQVHENAVVGGAVLCASPYAQKAAHAWSMCAKARFFERREYTATEKAANEREGKGVALGDIAHGEALSLARVGTKTVATALEVEGAKVVRFKVLAQGDHLNTWAEAHSWATRYLLPRERR